LSEVKPSTEETLRRLSEVLDVLKRISEDLQDISESLKSAKSSRIPTITSTTAATVAAPEFEGKGIKDIQMMLTKELEEMLIFEDKGNFIKITPRQYLGSENFAKIASAIREAGGEYISAGRDSHFRVPK
jgi:hypothetical protein